MKSVRSRRHLGVMICAFLASLAAFFPGNAQAQYDRFAWPQQYVMTPTGVNLQTGRFIYSKTDLTIGNLSLTRSWGDVPAMTVDDKSLGQLNMPGPTVANGWEHNLE